VGNSLTRQTLWRVQGTLTWLGHAGHLIHKSTTAISVDNVVGCAGAEAPAGDGSCRAVPARSWGQAVGCVGHTVAVQGAVLGAPGLGEGLEQQGLTGLDVCGAKQHSSKIPRQWTF
jgi:hypothetical protein